MHEDNQLRLEHYFNSVLRVAMYTVLPLIGLVVWVIAIPILLYGGVMSNLDDAQNAFQVLFIFSLPMLLFFVMFPLLMEKRKKITLQDLGLKFEVNKKNIVLLIINLGLVVYSFYRMITSGGDLQRIIPVLIQLCVIGISEEVLCRGVIYYEIQKIVNKDILCIIISSLIFGFIFHSGDSDITNLLVRVPLGLLFGSIRHYTGNVYNSIVMHTWYNALVITL